RGESAIGSNENGTARGWARAVPLFRSKGRLAGVAAPNLQRAVAAADLALVESAGDGGGAVARRAPAVDVLVVVGREGAAAVAEADIGLTATPTAFGQG